MSLAGPDADNTVLASFDHVPVFDANVLDNGGRLVLFCLRDTGAALPLPGLELVVHLDNVLLGSGNNASVVKHHAGDGVFIGIGVEDGAGPEIPYLFSRQ